MYIDLKNILMSDFLFCVWIEDWESLGACLWLYFRYVVVIVVLSLDGRGDIGKSIDENYEIWGVIFSPT